MAQTAGLVPIDMAAWHVDLLAFTGHKSLMGPTGIGGMCVGPDVEIRSIRWGGTGVKSAVRTPPRRVPLPLRGRHPEHGRHRRPARRPRRWVEAQGLDAIRKHEMELAGLLIDGLRDIPKVTLYCAGTTERDLPVVCCNIGDFEAGEAGMILDVEHDIATRTGLHCAPLAHEGIGTTPKGTVRFSIGPFNTREHVEAAIRGVADIAAMR